MTRISYHEIALNAAVAAETKVYMDFWENLRRGRLAPAWEDIDLIKLPLFMVPSTVVVDVIEDPLDFAYRFFDTNHTTTHGYDLTGKSILELTPRDYAEITFEQYRMVLDSRAPKIFLEQFPEKPELWCRYETTRLPLSSDGKTVDKILAVATRLKVMAVQPL